MPDHTSPGATGASPADADRTTRGGGGAGSSSAPSSFSELLAAAIAARGLSLARIRHHLAEEGLEVSVATLSYWATGRSRPTRSRSLEVVRGLEVLLGTPEGLLVEAMTEGVQARALGTVMGRDELLEQAVVDHDLPRSTGWQRLSCHYQVHVDGEGCQRRTDTRTLQAALQSRIQSWSVVVEHRPGITVSGSGRGSTRLQRCLHLADDLTVLVFGFDEPLERGARVMAHHGVDLEPDGELLTECGFAVKQEVPVLVLEVLFAGRRPRRVVRRHRKEADGDFVEVGPALRIDDHGAQCVVEHAVPGMHQLSLEW